MDPTQTSINVAAAAAPSSSGRSSSTVFGSLKWWPSLSSNSAAASSSGGSNNSSSSSSSANCSLSTTTGGGCSSASLLLRPSSSTASGVGQLQLQPQKLRESKWFRVDETRILCAVIEPGFVVEIREGQENESVFGVVLFKACKDKKPKPQDVEVYTIKQTSAATAASTGRLLRVQRRTLADLWLRGCTVRIQNFGDREHRPHSEKDIKNQIVFAQKAKQMLWQNSQHFAFWCRYGERQQDIRRKQVDAIRYKFPLGIVQ